jgi:hypothetical protein
MRRRAVLTALYLTLATGAWSQNSRDRVGRSSYGDSIPAGTRIPIRIDDAIDVRVPCDGQIFTGTVSEDVMSSTSSLMIPRGARAELIVQNTGDNEGTVDLDSISFEGRRYMVNAEKYDLSRRTGVGANKRTAKYMGGGAIFGTIVGALAGGGKGAAIGAAAGGAAGAGAQTLTRGNAIRVPAETVITFKLDEPLQLGVDPYNNDRGYDEDGHHYHNDYYHRDRH